MSGSCRDMGDCESRFLYENFATLYWWGYESCQCGNLQHHYWSSYDSTRIAGVLRSSEREQMPTYNGKSQSYRVPYEYNVFTFKFFCMFTLFFFVQPVLLHHPDHLHCWGGSCSSSTGLFFICESCSKPLTSLPSLPIPPLTLCLSFHFSCM